MATAKTVEKAWVVSPRPVSDPKDDAFGHADVARQLAEILRHLRAPCVVGLIGGFGVGKSTVGCLLQAQLRATGQQVVVAISAEKHTDVARQRAMVLSIAEALREQDESNWRSYDRAVAPLLASESVESLAPLLAPDVSVALDWRRLARKLWRPVLAWSLGVPAVLYFVSVVVGALSKMAGADLNPLTWMYGPAATFVLAIPIAGFLRAAGSLLGPRAAALLEPPTRTTERPRAEASDEIERVFKQLVTACPKELVVIVDDIDRLSPREVLEAISAIKTLIEVPRTNPPRFVVACDDEVVVEALAELDPGLSHAEDDGHVAAYLYLEKFFSARVRIPPVLDDDMTAYARKVICVDNHAAKNKFSSAELERLVDVLIPVHVNTPRRAVTLVNEFFTDYRFALQRETAQDGGPPLMTPGAVTRTPNLLAFLTVLRTEFPEVYNALRTDFARLRELRDWARGRTDEELPEDFFGEGRRAPRETSANTGISRLSSRERLRSYVARTLPLVPGDVPLEPFFYFGQTSATRVLGSVRAEQIRSALISGRPQLIVEDLGDEADQMATADTVVAVMQRSLRRGLDRSNALTAAAELLPSFTSENNRRKVADQSSVLLESDWSEEIEAQAVATVAQHASPEHADALAARLATRTPLPARAIWQLLAAQGSHPELVGALDEHFTTLSSEADWAAEREWVSLVHEVERARRETVLPPSFYKAIAELASGAEEISGDEHLLLESLWSDDDRAAAPEVAQAVANLLKSNDAAHQDLGMALAKARPVSPNDTAAFMLALATALEPPAEIDAYRAIDVLRVMGTLGKRVSLPPKTTETLDTAIAPMAARPETDLVVEAAHLAATCIRPQSGTLQATHSALIATVRDRIAQDDGLVHGIANAMLDGKYATAHRKELLDALMAPISIVRPNDHATEVAEFFRDRAFQEAQDEWATATSSRWLAELQSNDPSQPGYWTVTRSLAHVLPTISSLDLTALLTNLENYASRGQPYVEHSLCALGLILWPDSLHDRSIALLGQHLPTLSVDLQAEVVSNAAGWVDAREAVAAPFCEAVCQLAASRTAATDNAVASVAPVLAPQYAARISAEQHDAPFTPGIVASLPANALAAYLTQMAQIAHLPAGLDVARPNPALSSAIAETVTESLDFSDGTVSADQYDLLAGHLVAEDVAEPRAATFAAVREGRVPVTALRILAALPPAEPPEMADVLETLLEQLRSCEDETVATLLGKATRKIPQSRLDPVLKEVRRANRRPVAQAFSSARGK